jgi:hypothetical protein
MPEQPEDEELLFPCVVCGEESEALICDKCWKEYQRIAGIANGEEE